MWGLWFNLLLISTDCQNFTASTVRAYNTLALSYQSSHAHVSPNVVRLREGFISLLPKKGRILDLGSGPGRDSSYFQNQGYWVTAIDPSQEMVKLAQNALGELGEALTLSAEQMYFEGSYDGVWAMASLIHIPNKALKDVFVRIYRALKPGGIFLGSFIKGIGVPDQGETIGDGRFFNRVSQGRLLQIVAEIPGFEVIPELTYTNDDDFHGANKPSPDFGFFNLTLRKKVE